MLPDTGTISDLLAAATADVPAATYLIGEGGDQLTYSEVHRRANGAAVALSSAGAPPRRVGVLSSNDPRMVVAWFGIARAGAAMVPLDPAATPQELIGAARACGLSHLIADEEMLGTAREAAREAGVGSCLSLAEVTRDEVDAGPAIGVDAEDTVVLLSTSGTSGASKYVVQSHRSFVLAAEGFPWWLGLDGRDRLMTPLPLFHLNALAYSTLGALVARASVVILRRFSASKFISQAREYGATQFNAVGALLEMLVRQPRRSDDRVNPLRLCYAAPAPATRERHEEIENRFGMKVTAGYALSETPYGTIWPRGERPFGSMGALRQHPRLGEINHARVVSDDGRDVVDGEVGELLLRNPAVMAGYLGRPDDTAATLRDGWLHTGDLVRRDAGGYFFFVARKKDIIRRRGENIAPTEVEDAMSTHPSVKEVVVVGVPSELGEEDVKAFVVLTSQEVDARALAVHARKRLAAHKVPRFIEFVEALPRTPTGRVARHRLSRDARGIDVSNR